MKNSHYITATIVLVAIVLSLVSVAIVFRYAHQSDDERKNSLIYQNETTYSVEKLAFCLTNGITTCNDEMIRTWNAQNKDAQFVLKSYEGIVDEALDQYNAER